IATGWNNSSTAARSTATPATRKPPPATAAAGTSPPTASPNTSASSMTIDADLARLRRAVAEPLPHPDPDELQSMSRQVADWVVRHWIALPQEPVGRTASRRQMEALLRQPPPEQGRAFAEVLADFQDKVAANALSTKHPRFLAFVPGTPCYPAVLADWLCAGTNFF